MLGCAHTPSVTQAKPPKEPDFIRSELTGAKVRWKKNVFPIVLVVHPDLKEWWYDVYVAAEYWNTMMRQRMFIFDVSVADIMFNRQNMTFIYIQPGDPAKNPYTRIIFDHATGEIQNAPIFLPPNVRYELRLRVAVHELGHAIGLAHDPGNDESVMHPYALFGPFEITKSDRASLASWYFSEQ